MQPQHNTQPAMASELAPSPLTVTNPLACDLDGPDIFPEWMRQRQMIQAGEATWDDFTFEERTCKGWLIPYLDEIDRMLSGRWDFWVVLIEDGVLLDHHIIPRIDFCSAPNPETMKMLRKCLEDYQVTYSGARLPDFIDWILWGFGEGDERPMRVNEKLNEHWYRTFNLGLMLQHPHDYLGELLSESKGGNTYWNNPNAFFPTPHNVVEMMVRMQFESVDQDNAVDTRPMSVCDPCVGTGRMLLHASNYSLNLYGMDIDPVCIAACRVNGFLYAPWLVRPAPWIDGLHWVEYAEPGVVTGDAIRSPPGFAPASVVNIPPVKAVVKEGGNGKQKRQKKDGEQLSMF